MFMSGSANEAPYVLRWRGGERGSNRGSTGISVTHPARRAWESQAFEEAHKSTAVKMGALGEWAGVRGAIQPFLDP